MNRLENLHIWHKSKQRIIAPTQINLEERTASFDRLSLGRNFQTASFNSVVFLELARDLRMTGAGESLLFDFFLNTDNEIDFEDYLSEKGVDYSDLVK